MSVTAVKAKNYNAAVQLRGDPEQGEDNPAALQSDPNNDWHWRFNRRQLDAESLRDTLLWLSGDLELGTPKALPGNMWSPGDWPNAVEPPCSEFHTSPVL